MHITTDSIALSEAIHDLMTSRGLTLSTAESCTSGRIAAILTSVSGASDYFQGALVAYQDDVKTKWLGVDPQTIATYDVVSRQVAEQMVKGACQLFGTDMALASTGYAGGGTDTIPSGTIWIAWGRADDVHSLCLHEDCGREANTANAAQTAVRKLLEYLSAAPSLRAPASPPHASL